MKPSAHEIVGRRDALQPLDLRRTRQSDDAGDPHEYGDKVLTDHDVHTARELRMHTSRPVGLTRSGVDFAYQTSEPLTAHPRR
nr:hypothetical protein [Rhodococcus erythropolis]